MPRIDDLVNTYAKRHPNSTSIEALKEKLTLNEKKILTELVDEMAKDHKDYAVKEYDNLLAHSRRLQKELDVAENNIKLCKKDIYQLTQKLYEYKGFHDVLLDEHSITSGGKEYMSKDEFGEIRVSHEYLLGIEKAVNYLKTTPDQVIQHYGDPNPKEKVSRYYHHKDKE